MQNYKSTATDLEGLEDLDLNEDATSDEYDFMDDAEGDKDKQRTQPRNREPRRKYLDVLQRVADRQEKQITIELDDLDNVCPLPQLAIRD